MNETQRDDAIDQMREIAALREVNADLLAACEEAVAEVWDGKRLDFHDALSASIIRDKCLAAIAKAKAEVT